MGIRNRGTLRKGTRRRRERTRRLQGRTLPLLALTLLHLGHTLHSLGHTLHSMGTLNLVATHRTVAIPLQVTQAQLRRTRVMGVAMVDHTWEQC